MPRESTGDFAGTFGYDSDFSKLTAIYMHDFIKFTKIFMSQNDACNESGFHVEGVIFSPREYLFEDTRGWRLLHLKYLV